jgi:hypothetical protein
MELLQVYVAAAAVRHRQQRYTLPCDANGDLATALRLGLSSLASQLPA